MLPHRIWCTCTVLAALVIAATAPGLHLPGLGDLAVPATHPLIGLLATFDPPVAVLQAGFLLAGSGLALWGLGWAADREIRAG